MIKENKKIYNIIVLLLLGIFILLYRLVIYKYLLAYSEAISASFIMLFTGLLLLLYGFRKHNNSKWTEKFFKATLFVIVLYFIIIYVIGITTGYLRNAYSLKLMSIIDNMIYPIIIIIFTEISRYIFIKGNKNSLPLIIIFNILLIIFDANFYIKMDSFNSFNSVFEFATITLIPIVLKNIVCSYSSYYSDYKSTLIYRGFTELYIYIAPIQPNLDKLIVSISSMMLPFMLLMLYSGIVENQSESHNKSKKQMRLSDIPLLLLMVLFACIIFGIGPFKLIGIETGSMAPKYNRGDGVIVDKNVNKDELKVGDVIAYYDKDNKLIVHRIINKNIDESFTTKGDYNNTADSSFVKKDQIFGIVRFKIPWIAYPSLVLRK